MTSNLSDRCAAITTISSAIPTARAWSNRSRARDCQPATDTTHEDQPHAFIRTRAGSRVGCIRGLVLRGLFDKFLQRDLAAERRLIRDAHAALGARGDSYEKRFEAVKSNHAAAERRAAAFDRDLDRWVAHASASLASAKAEKEQLDVEADAIKQLFKQINDEISAIEAEGPELADEGKKVTERLDAISETEKRRTRNIYRFGFVAELITGATVFIPFTGWAEHSAHVVHLDYYSAVAAITPVLFVAGLVEVALLGLFPGRWLVACFSLPAVAATVGALIALGTHHSTPATFSLTLWGLVATTLALILYFVIHSESSSSKAAM